MRLRQSVAYMVMGIVIGLAACEKAEETPTPTPNQESIQAASTLFAQPTRSTLPTPTVTPVNEVELDLSRTVARMEQAVGGGNYEAYMAYVWDGDPVFWNDHAHWARDWVDHPLSIFSIELYGIRAVPPDAAEARMTIRWRLDEYQDGGLSGGSTISATFYRQGDRWLFGGESWKTAEVEGIKFYYFANEIIDNQPQADIVLEYLPSIHVRTTREFDFEPDKTAHVKMYESPVMLYNWTRISMPTLSVWNEPGESIKITLGPNGIAPHESLIAREYTRFLLFEMGGGQRGDYPWWFETGISEYGGSMFNTFSQRNRMIKRVAGVSLANPNQELRLLDWDALDAAPTLSTDAMQIAVEQSFTLIHYITETYGADARNAWIKAVVGGQSVDAACQEHLGIAFDDLSAAWRAWLPQQL